MASACSSVWAPLRLSMRSTSEAPSGAAYTKSPLLRHPAKTSVLQWCSCLPRFPASFSQWCSLSRSSAPCRAGSLRCRLARLRRRPPTPHETVSNAALCSCRWSHPAHGATSSCATSMRTTSCPAWRAPRANSSVSIAVEPSRLGLPCKTTILIGLPLFSLMRATNAPKTDRRRPERPTRTP